MKSIRKQTVAVIVYTVLLRLNTGCMVNKVRKLDPGNVPQPQQEHIVGITTKTGEEVGFDPPGANVNQTNIVGKVRQAPYSIAIADVQRLWVERRETSVARTVGLTVGIAAVALLTVFLAASDDRYYQMPSNSDCAEIEFPAPERKTGMERTIFLHSRGWYQLHLRQNGEPDNAAVAKIMAVPGKAARFAVARFAEWRKGEIQ